MIVGLMGNSFNWTNIPYPLQYSYDGRYELTVRPQNWDVATQGAPPTVANSGFFTIAPRAGEGPPSTSIPQVSAPWRGRGLARNAGSHVARCPSRADLAPKPSLSPAPSASPGSTPASNKALIVGVCVGLGIPLLAGVGIGTWCMQRRRKRALEIKRRQMRFEMNIH